MTIRNLNALFQPRSVAMLYDGHSDVKGAAALLQNLLTGGFKGKLMLIGACPEAYTDPLPESLNHLKSLDDLNQSPDLVPDLAMLCITPETVPETIRDLGQKGCRAAVLFGSGFGDHPDEEQRKHGKALLQKALDAAKPHLMRLLGPNSFGLAVPGIGLNAAALHRQPNKGDVAFLSQSGTLISTVVDWANERAIGFSHLVSLGEKSDVDFGDMLDYLSGDYRARAILLYMEELNDIRKFMSAARTAARSKPVIVVKGGRHRETAEAVIHHTGALLGSDAVYDAAFRRTGLLRVTRLEELFDAVETLSFAHEPSGNRLAILTNGGGVGVMATDNLLDYGGQLATLSPESLEALNEALPTLWSRSNPIDATDEASAAHFETAIRILMKDKNVDGILVVHCPEVHGGATETAQRICDLAKEKRGARRLPKTLLTSWLGPTVSAEAKKLFVENQIPTYDNPHQAVRSFMHMVDYSRAQEQLMVTPPSYPEDFDPNPIGIQEMLDEALGKGRKILPAHKVEKLFAAYGIPIVPTRLVKEAEDVAEAARSLTAEAKKLGQGIPAYVVKLLSPDFVKKSAMMAVRLDLDKPEHCTLAAMEMEAGLQLINPDARLDGFMVQPMVRGRQHEELSVGMRDEPRFGPVLRFGEGGIASDVMADEALAFPPLNLSLAHETIRRTRVFKRLNGFAGRAPADLDAIALTLVKIAQITADHPEITSIDINPLLAGPEGVMALDATLHIAPIAENRSGTKRFAIRPYPVHLERRLKLRNGDWIFLRPIRPEDEPLLKDFFSKEKPEDLRLRFFAPVQDPSHKFLARLTQLDYDREMSLIAFKEKTDAEAEPETLGMVSINADPDNLRGEYAVMVRGDLKGMGLGWVLMESIIDYAKKRGMIEIFGEVLQENTGMLGMCRKLGFKVAISEDDPGVMHVTMPLKGDLKLS